MKNPPDFTPGLVGNKNADTVADYRRSLELQQLGRLTINGYLWKLHYLLEYFEFKPAYEIGKQDIQDYIITRRNEKKQRTVNGDIIALRKFYDWLKPGNDYFDGIKVKRPRNYLPVEQLLTPEDVKKLISACKS